jgi:hypothetical protein
MEHPNIAAVLVAALATFLFGWLWYTPLFGKAWAGEMGLSLDTKPTSGQMAKGMIIMIIGCLLTAHVFANNASAWGVAMPTGPFQAGFLGAFFTWLGFYVPQHMNRVAWEGKSWKLFFINAGHSLGALLIIGWIIAYWK